MDLPDDVIRIIVSKQHLDIYTLNTFREVCLRNQHLYFNLYPDLTKDVQKRGILKITEEKINEVEDYTKDIEYIKNSSFLV